MSQFFNPDAPLEIYEENLPHWRQEGVFYFVTYRLCDSLPIEKLRWLQAERSAWLARHPEPHTNAELSEYWELFSEKIHKWLDSGIGKCPLRQPAVREIVAESLHFGNGSRYELTSFVIMPNHVHAVLSPIAEEPLTKILQTWKSYTAKKINSLLGLSGSFWQKESYDHIIRSPAALSAICHYIQQNPIKANLQPNAYTLYPNPTSVEPEIRSKGG